MRIFMLLYPKYTTLWFKHTLIVGMDFSFCVYMCVCVDFIGV